MQIFIKERIYTKKAKNLIGLFDKGLRMPETFILQNMSEISNLKKGLKAINVEYFYLRLSFSDNIYPSHFSLSTHREHLEKNIVKLKEHAQSTNNHSFDIIIQPILNFTWSGAAIIKDDFILVEIVFGHPIALFRLGEFKFRLLFDNNMKLLDINEGLQKSYLKWNNEELIITNNIIRDTRLEEIIIELKNLRISEQLIYEFGFSGEKFYYLEFKEINPDSYKKINGKIIQKPFSIYESKLNHNNDILMKIDVPAITHLKDINHEQKIVVESGAFLSHLATYAATNSINCSFEK